MDEILVTQDKTVEEFVSEAKEKNPVKIKGKGRDTVKAVDVAEALKLEGFKEKSINIDTEEEIKDEKTFRISTLDIELEK